MSDGIARNHRADLFRGSRGKAGSRRLRLKRLVAEVRVDPQVPRDVTLETVRPRAVASTAAGPSAGGD